MTAPWTTNPLDDHVERVQLLSNAGVAPPMPWFELYDRLTGFVHRDQNPIRDRFTQAVIDGIDCDLEALRALALGESVRNDGLNDHVRQKAFERLVAIYDEYAPEAWRQIADKFNDACSKFVKTASATDVEAAAAAMVDAPDKARRAWIESEGLAHQLERLLPAVQAAAALAGIPDTDSDTVLIALVVDPGGAHRRRLWESWVTQDARCGRWARLLKAGAVLRAATDLGQLQPYREPQPMQSRREPIPGSSAYRTIEVDPEDADYRPELIDPRRGSTGRAAMV